MGEHDKYDEQYNPHHDFAIFGQGDPRGGGLQTLQQKMNLADDVAEGNSSDSDESIDKKEKMNGKHYEEVAMSSLDVSLTARPTSTARDSAAVLNQAAPALPEDNEIVEATNEDEE